MSSFFAMIHGAVMPSLNKRRLSGCRYSCDIEALLVTGHLNDLMYNSASLGERGVQNAVLHVDVLHAVSVEVVHISGHLCLQTPRDTHFSVVKNPAISGFARYSGA